jgi:hypothetical protein
MERHTTSQRESNLLVYENNNYTVTVGPSQLLEGAEVYLCRNKYTNVIEVEDTMLPKIIDYAQQLDSAATELMENENMYPDKQEH